MTPTRLAPVLLTLALSLSLRADTTVWLDEMDLSTMTCGWGKVHAKASVGGNPLTIGGKTFERGSARPPSRSRRWSRCCRPLIRPGCARAP